MAVALLTAERQNIEALRGNQVTERATGAVDDRLYRQILLSGEVVDGMFAMFDRSDKEVAEHRREGAGEDDGGLVPVGDVMGIVGVASEEFADEASSADEIEVGVRLPRHTCSHRHHLSDPQDSFIEPGSADIPTT